MTFPSESAGFGLIQTLGSGLGEQSQVGVDIVSVQHAWVFESTTIRSSDAHAVIQWLKEKGYIASPLVKPIVTRYVKDAGHLLLASWVVTTPTRAKPRYTRWHLSLRLMFRCIRCNYRLQPGAIAP